MVGNVWWNWGQSNLLIHKSYVHGKFHHWYCQPTSSPNEYFPFCCHSMMFYDGVVWSCWIKPGALFWKFCNMIFILMVQQMIFYDRFLEDLVDVILLAIKVWQNNSRCSWGLHKHLIAKFNLNFVIIWISGVHLELDYHWVIKTLRWKILDDT